MWQDYALGFVQAVFAVALIPSLLDRQKPALSTSVMNAGGMIIVTTVYFSLYLWISAWVATAVAIQWVILGLQRYWQPKTGLTQRNPRRS